MSDSKGYVNHAVQIVSLKVMKMSLIVNGTQDQRKLPESGSFSLKNSYTKFDTENKKIGVKLEIYIDSEEDNSPFDLNVELAASFKVDTSKFNPDYVEDWASKNAPLILYPYLREHVHTLTIKAGYDGLLLPLFEIPTFRLAED